MKTLLVRPVGLGISIDTTKGADRVIDKHQPLGLLYLATALKGHVERIRISDEHFGDPTEEIIDEFQPDLVLITHTTPVIHRVEAITRHAHERGAKVVTGGPHPSAAPEATLKRTGCDAACVGEGEEVVVELTKTKDWSKIKGLAIPGGNGFEHRPVRKDLDNIPFPDRKLLPPDRYYEDFELGFPKRATDIMFRLFSTRGCPYHCAFCGSHNVWKRGWRARSVENVVEEMAQLHVDYSCRHFFFMDDEFTIREDRVVKLCETLLRKNYPFLWGCSARTGLSGETMRLMKLAGCRIVSFGLESGSPKMLKIMRKDASPDSVIKTLDLAHTFGIRTKASVLIGVPGEEPDDIRMTLEVTNRANPDYLWVSMFTPLPGTELFETMHLDAMTYETEGTYFNKEDKELQEAHRNFIRSFYIRPGYLKKYLGRFNLIELVQHLQLARIFFKSV